LKDPSLLKYIFESGIAFLTFDGCPFIDMVIPLRILNKADVEGVTSTEFEHVPMLLSIKYDNHSTSAQMKEECDAMKERAKMDGIDKALCLLIIFTSDGPANSSTTDDELEMKGSEKVSKLVMEGVVARVVRVPSTDEFGLAAAYNALAQHERDAMLFMAHPYLMAHGPGKDNGANANAEMALCGFSASDEWKQDYNALRDAMTRRSSGQAKP
jgi:hypothetical protein